jgi:hypothetical protein
MAHVRIIKNRALHVLEGQINECLNQNRSATSVDVKLVESSEPASDFGNPPKVPVYIALITFTTTP